MSRHDLVQRALRLLTQPIETVEANAALKQQQAIDQAPTVHPGDQIEWQRLGAVQQGFVDFLHDDPDGTTWAFVTLADRSWAAVNVKFITHPPVSPDAVAEWSEGT